MRIVTFQMPNRKPAPVPPLEWNEAGDLVMQDSVVNWRMLGHLMMSPESISEVLESAERERRVLESQESRSREPRETEEQAVARLRKDLRSWQYCCARVAGGMLFAAFGLDCLGAEELATAALTLLMMALFLFTVNLLVQGWVWIFQKFGI